MATPLAAGMRSGWLGGSAGIGLCGDTGDGSTPGGTSAGDISASRLRDDTGLLARSPDAVVNCASGGSARAISAAAASPRPVAEDPAGPLAPEVAAGPEPERWPARAHAARPLSHQHHRTAPDPHRPAVAGVGRRPGTVANGASAPEATGDPAATDGLEAAAGAEPERRHVAAGDAGRCGGPPHFDDPGLRRQATTEAVTAAAAAITPARAAGSPAMTMGRAEPTGVRPAQPQVEAREDAGRHLPRHRLRDANRRRPATAAPAPCPRASAAATTPTEIGDSPAGTIGAADAAGARSERRQLAARAGGQSTRQRHDLEPSLRPRRRTSAAGRQPDDSRRARRGAPAAALGDRAEGWSPPATVVSPDALAVGRIRLADEFQRVHEDMLRARRPGTCRGLAQALAVDKMTVWRWRRQIVRAWQDAATPLAEGSPASERGSAAARAGAVDAAAAASKRLRESRKGSRLWVSHRHDPGAAPEPHRPRWVDVDRLGEPLPRPLWTFQDIVTFGVDPRGRHHTTVRPAGPPGSAEGPVTAAEPPEHSGAPLRARFAAFLGPFRGPTAVNLAGYAAWFAARLDDAGEARQRESGCRTTASGVGGA
jgi:hypothetical protein